MSHKDKITKGYLLETQTVCLLLKLFEPIDTCSYTHNFMTNVKNMCPSHTFTHAFV